MKAEPIWTTDTDKLKTLRQTQKQKEEVDDSSQKNGPRAVGDEVPSQ